MQNQVEVYLVPANFESDRMTTQARPGFQVQFQNGGSQSQIFRLLSWWISSEWQALWRLTLQWVEKPNVHLQ